MLHLTLSIAASIYIAFIVYAIFDGRTIAKNNEACLELYETNPFIFPGVLAVCLLVTFTAFYS